MVGYIFCFSLVLSVRATNSVSGFHGFIYNIISNDIFLLPCLLVVGNGLTSLQDDLIYNLKAYSLFFKFIFVKGHLYEDRLEVQYVV